MDASFLSGQLLIAMPGIGDDRFERSVILICAHDETHAMGITVNQPLDGIMVTDILEQLEVKTETALASEPVLLGGPVQQERGFVLHTDDFAVPQSLEVGLEGVTLTATRDALEAMADPDRHPRRSLLALGYAGWGAGQIESEIRQNVWLTCPADEDLVFDRDHHTKWGRALAKLGIDPKRLSGAVGRA